MNKLVHFAKLLMGSERSRRLRLRALSLMGGVPVSDDNVEKTSVADEINSNSLQSEISALRVFSGIDKPPSQHSGPVSCRMADGVYIQADGSLPCYCSGGITRQLGAVSGPDFFEFFNGKTMRVLREHLAEGVFPWPECEGCHVKTTSPQAIPAITPEKISIIHVEPTSVCNLRCPGCHATEVMEGRAPKRRTFLPFDAFKQMIDSIEIPVNQISFCGYGEPLLNTDVPRMISYAKETLSPSPSCTIDTNANIRKIDADELILSGVNLIRFALDGAFQENYEKYRRKGNIDLALSFVRKIAEARDRHKAGTKLVWKYVIFEHCSSIEEIEEAIKFCGEVGIGFDYSRAPGVLAAAKNRVVLEEEIRDLLARYGVVDRVGGLLRQDKSKITSEEDVWKYA